MKSDTHSPSQREAVIVDAHEMKGTATFAILVCCSRRRFHDADGTLQHETTRYASLLSVHQNSSLQHNTLVDRRLHDHPPRKATRSGLQRCLLAALLPTVLALATTAVVNQQANNTHRSRSDCGYRTLSSMSGGRQENHGQREVRGQ